MDFDMDYDAGSMDVEESDVSDTFDDVSDEEYEESELDVMLDGIQDGRTDLEELDEGQENWEREQMLKEWEENSDDDDQKVYVKTYPR